MLKVLTGPNAIEMHLLSDALRQEGIEASVQENTPGLIPGENASLWIENPEEEERARALLHEMSSGIPKGKGERDPGGGSHFVSGALVGLCAGLAMGWFLFHVSSSQQSNWDRNGDGQPDAWATYYPGGVISESSFDQNYDGEPDAWHAFDERGDVTSSRYDNDFDGDEDYWERSEQGILVSYQADNDGDGAVDEWGTVEHSAIKDRRWSFANDSIVDKQAFYREGKRIREEYDRDRDGHVDEVVHLDPFERVSRRESR